MLRLRFTTLCLIAAASVFSACGPVAVDPRGPEDGGVSLDGGPLPDASVADGGQVADAGHDVDAGPGDGGGEAADSGVIVPDGGGFISDGGVAAAIFNGSTGYVEIPDADAFSEPTAHGVTVEAWIRPDTLAMPNTEGGGYVHWMGKGEPGTHEWVCRMYQTGNTDGRANRISFYAFNPQGGLGAGSYFQDTVTAGAWIHVVGVIDDSSTFIFKNGAQRDTDLLAGYSIVPTNTASKVRIATRDFNSFFQGSISRVAIYSGVLPQARIAAHYAARGASNYDAVILGEPTVKAYWKLDETSGTVAADATGQHPGSYHGGVNLGAAQWTP